MVKTENSTIRILIANLRHFYQCRRLWPAYLLYGFFLWCSLSLVRLRSGVAFTVLVPAGLIAGWVVAAVQEEVASKPSSFCLPGYRESLRRFVFVVGLVIGAIGGVYFAVVHGSSDIPLGQFALMLCLTLCFTGTMYLTGTILTLTVGSTLMISGVLLAALGISCLGKLIPDFDHTLLGHPCLVISLAALMAVVVWLWLGRPNWFRGRCGKPASGLLSASARSSEQEDRQLVVSINLPHFDPAVDDRLLAIVRACDHHSSAKYILGTLYSTLLPVFLVTSRWKVSVPWMLLLLMVTLLAGYAPSFAAVFVFGIVQVPAMGLDKLSPLFSQMLVSGGRRERLYATVLLTLILAGLSTMVLMLPVLALNLLAPVLPEVRIYGSVLTFHRIPVWLAMLSMIIFPVLGLLDFSLHGRKVGGMISCAIGIVALNLLIFHPVSGVPVTTLVLVGVLSWVVFVLGVYRIAMRSDLVKE